MVQVTKYYGDIASKKEAQKIFLFVRRYLLLANLFAIMHE